MYACVPKIKEPSHMRRFFLALLETQALLMDKKKNHNLKLKIRLSGPTCMM